MPSAPSAASVATANNLCHATPINFVAPTWIGSQQLTMLTVLTQTPAFVRIIVLKTMALVGPP
jgi:hypothetical protein